MLPATLDGAVSGMAGSCLLLCNAIILFAEKDFCCWKGERVWCCMLSMQCSFLVRWIKTRGAVVVDYKGSFTAVAILFMLWGYFTWPDIKKRLERKQGVPNIVLWIVLFIYLWFFVFITDQCWWIAFREQVDCGDWLTMVDQSGGFTTISTSEFVITSNSDSYWRLSLCQVFGFVFLFVCCFHQNRLINCLQWARWLKR